MPPTPITGSCPAVCLCTYSTIRRDRSVSGRPDRPPASAARDWSAAAMPSRAIVVLVAISPATRSSVQTASSSSTAASVRSGAIFTSTGLGVSLPLASTSASCRSAASSSRSWPASCNERGHVVIDGLVQRGDLRLADADPERMAEVAVPLQPRGERRRPLVVEPHPVDDRPALHQPEQPRPLVPRLRLRRHGPHLDEPEPERPPSRQRHPVLVHPRRQPNRPGKPHPEHSPLKLGVQPAIGLHESPYDGPPRTKSCERRECPLMRDFSVAPTDPVQNRPDDPLIGPAHRTPPPAATRTYPRPRREPQSVHRSLFQFLWKTGKVTAGVHVSAFSTVIGADVSATCDWEDWVCCPADVVVSWCLWPDPQCDAGTSGTCDCCRERVPQTLDQQVPPDGAVRR